jgi:tetratricopeptide (TPR) repeat protein
MNDNFQKILELLQKDVLSKQDQLLIDNILKTDSGAAQLYNTYLRIKDATKLTGHLLAEDLYNYILYKNSQEPEDKTIISKIPFIEEHLRVCEQCNNEFKNFNSEFINIDNYISKTFTNSPVKEHDENDVSIFVALQRQLSFSRNTFITLIVLGFIYLGLYLTAPLTVPVTKKLALMHDQSELYITRGRATNDFQMSLTALAKNDYNRAIIYLNRDIIKNRNDETIFYSYYILGLAHLINAEERILGIFPDFDKSEVHKGLKALESAIVKNHSGRYPNITLDAYYYIAKAQLMLNNVDKAKKYLNMVIDLRGSKVRQAENMLKALE